MIGSQATGKLTERATKHLECAAWCREFALALSEPGATVTLGRRVTSTNWPLPSGDSSITPTASSTYASTTTPASEQRCKYQSLWQAERDATRSSSGFHRARSPRNAGSEEPGMV